MSDGQSTPMIEVKGLVKRFGDFTAVDGLDFHVSKGEVLGFLGPNGAGKSTAMRMITGFLSPTAGTVEICGHDIRHDTIAAQRRIGYLPEGAPCYPDMTPRAFLNFIADVRGLRGVSRSAALDKVVADTALAGVLEQPIETLSKGFTRRVGLAQAMLHDPDILILDEPTDGLDPNQKFEVRNLISAMAATKAIIISTHILEEVNAVCTRNIILDRGRIVADCGPHELAARSRFHNAVFLTPGRECPDASVIIEALEQLSQISAVEPVTDRRRLQDAGDADSRVALTAFSKDGRPIVGLVSGVARDKGWVLDEIYVSSGHLDDVFRDLTSGAA